MTNFDLGHYDVEGILKSPNIPIGKGASKFIRWTPADDILQSRRNTKIVPVLQQVDSSGNPNLTTIAPPYILEPSQLLETPSNPNPEQQYICPSLNSNQNNDQIQINQFLQYYNNNPNGQNHFYQNPNFPINPSFNNWFNYGGNEQMEPSFQFQYILSPENHEFQFHQYNSDNFQHHLPQNPSSSSLRDSQNSSSQENPNFFSELTNLPSGSDIKEFPSSQEQEASLARMGTNEGDYTNEVDGKGNVAEDFRVDKPDLDISSSSWLEMFLMTLNSSD